MGRDCISSAEESVMWRMLGVFVGMSASLFGQAATGNEKYDQKQYADAIAAYESIPQAERDLGVLNRLGISYHMLNRLKEAEFAYRASIRLDTTGSSAANNLATLYYSQRK